MSRGNRDKYNPKITSPSESNFTIEDEPNDYVEPGTRAQVSRVSSFEHRRDVPYCSDITGGSVFHRHANKKEKGQEKFQRKIGDESF